MRNFLCKCKCGHYELVNIAGPLEEVQEHIRYIEKNLLCEECLVQAEQETEDVSAGLIATVKPGITTGTIPSSGCWIISFSGAVYDHRDDIRRIGGEWSRRLHKYGFILYREPGDDIPAALMELLEGIGATVKADMQGEEKVIEHEVNI